MLDEAARSSNLIRPTNLRVHTSVRAQIGKFLQLLQGSFRYAVRIHKT